MTLSNKYFAHKWIPNGDIWRHFCAGFYLCSLIAIVAILHLYTLIFFISKSQTFFRKTSLIFSNKTKNAHSFFSSSVLFFIFLLQFHLSFDDLFFVFLRLLNQKFHSLNIHFYSTCKKFDTRIRLDQFLLSNLNLHFLISF